MTLIQKKSSMLSWNMYNLETINRLLQNEISATETYQQVFEKLQDEHEINTSKLLIPIYESHKDAVSVLQAHIRELGGAPSEHSSVWQTWSKIVQGGAHKLGKQTVLSMLQQGEKVATEDYQKVLWNPRLSRRAKLSQSDIRLISSAGRQL